MKKFKFIPLMLLLLVGCQTTRNNSGFPEILFNELPWQLGVSRDSVVSFSEYGPYKHVNVTGGLETSNGKFLGEKANISFVFSSDNLDFIQVWAYEGEDYNAAKERWLKIYHYFDSNFGGVEIPNVTAEEGFDEAAVAVVSDRVIGMAPELTKKFEKDGATGTFILDMLPVKQPKNVTLTGKLVYSGQHDTFYTFVFIDRPNTQGRLTKNMVEINKLRI
ncbi:hypothetical protein ACQ661_12400 [Pseudidiomarina sp. WS423]|uniref:hypothetical protein n=1 Tax=Pseudidiomarina sp. WS423 TaxID=3425124 RepID=UPI003D701278